MNQTETAEALNQNPNLSPRSYVTLVIYCFIILCVFRPICFSVTVPARLKKCLRFSKLSLQIDYAWGSVIGVILMWISTCIGWEQISGGIVGNEQIQPLSIFILFFSLAYICISLDITGLLRYIALLVAVKSGGSTVRLFIYFFLFVSILTIFTSNDIVILTMSVMLIYFCGERELNPLPFLMAEFVAANCLSLTLFIGNPTNVIVAEAYNLSFFEYTKWMGIPSLSAGVISLGMCLILFWKDIQKQGKIDDHLTAASVRRELVNSSGAFWTSVILISCLTALVVTSFFQVKVWMVTLPFAVISLLRDLVQDWIQHRTASFKAPTDSEIPDELDTIELKTENFETGLIQKTSRSTFQRRFPTVHAVGTRMPWKIGPFIICMFIVVEALDSVGWITLLAQLLQAAVSRGPIQCSLIMTIITSLACILLNNQPMTILFTKILLNPIFAKQVSPLELQAAMFALIMGSNFGANLSLNGALAGLMWDKILTEKQVHGMTFFRFSRQGFFITIPVIVVSSLILGAELSYWN